MSPMPAVDPGERKRRRRWSPSGIREAVLELEKAHQESLDFATLPYASSMKPWHKQLAWLLVQGLTVKEAVDRLGKKSQSCYSAMHNDSWRRYYAGLETEITRAVLRRASFLENAALSRLTAIVEDGSERSALDGIEIALRLSERSQNLLGKKGANGTQIYSDKTVVLGNGGNVDGGQKQIGGEEKDLMQKLLMARTERKNGEQVPQE